MKIHPAFQKKDFGISLALHVQPGAKRNQVIGFHGERLKLAVKAKAQDGKANQAVLDLLAFFFGIAKSQVSLKKGESSRQKVVEIQDISIEKAIDVVLSHHLA